MFQSFQALVVLPSEKAMAPHSSTLAWKIPWTEEPGRLQSMWSWRVTHDWATSLSLFTFMHWRRKWQPTPVFLPGESPGCGSLVGCRLWGPTESHRTDLAAGIQKHCITILCKTFSLLADCLSMDSNCTTWYTRFFVIWPQLTISVFSSPFFLWIAYVHGRLKHFLLPLCFHPIFSFYFCHQEYPSLFPALKTYPESSTFPTTFINT